MTRTLLVSPAFHGYWRSIADAFERRGHEVAVHLVDQRDTWGKVRHKVLVEGAARLGRTDDRAERETTEAAVDALRRHRPDRVLVVKGDLLGEQFAEALGTTPRLLWLYDELRRTAHTAQTLAAYPAVASYSRHDVAHLAATGHHAVHVPLAFDHHAPVVRPRHTREVVFVGARYPRREALLVELAGRGVPVRAFGRDWSHSPLDRARTWSWGRPALSAGRDLARDDAYAVMAGAPATLNIHGDQDGFTMRTFEACGIGAVQAIDRADVTEFYVPDEHLVVFDGIDALAALTARAVADDRWGDRLREAGRAHTLAHHTFDHRAAALDELWAVPS